jgi:hypothetical protein
MSVPLRVTVVFALLLGAEACAASPERIPVSPASSVHLTIYNDNFAVVREEREVDLRAGLNQVRVTGVAAQIDPTSVSLRSLTAPGAVVVREQNYQYDFITPNAVLNKSVGKTVAIRLPSTGGGERMLFGTLLNPVEAILPSSEITGVYPPYGYGYPYDRGFPRNLGGLVVKTDHGVSVIRTLQGEGMVVDLGDDALPKNMISEPQLLWKLESTKAGKHRCRISYITDLVNWKADYIAVVDEQEKEVDLNAWVTITNSSGTAYRDASLQLMAGDVRRITPEEARRRAAGGYGGPLNALTPATPRPQFVEQAFFEYHLYTLDGTTTVADKETKQMTLLSASAVPVKKAYVYEGGRFEWQRWLTSEYYQYPSAYGQPEAPSASPIKTVGVVLEIENSKSRHLGIPLPAGKVRVYKADSEGRLQFIGEDQIAHTPRDEKVRLLIGNAFDIVGERKRTNLKVISPSEYEESFEITLRNHKDQPVEVVVVEHPFASWEVLEKSQDYKKRDAHTIEFTVPVPARGQASVTYRVRVVH